MCGSSWLIINATVCVPAYYWTAHEEIVPGFVEGNKHAYFMLRMDIILLNQRIRFWGLKVLRGRISIIDEKKNISLNKRIDTVLYCLMEPFYDEGRGRSIFSFISKIWKKFHDIISSGQLNLKICPYPKWTDSYFIVQLKRICFCCQIKRPFSLNNKHGP